MNEQVCVIDEGDGAECAGVVLRPHPTTVKHATIEEELRGEMMRGETRNCTWKALADLGLAAHVDAVGVTVLLDVVHPVDVGFELRVGGGDAGSANELQSVIVYFEGAIA